MKQKTIYTLLFLIACFLGGAPLSVHAQPALVKKAAAQVFTLTTFAADGKPQIDSTPAILRLRFSSET